jgi:hypothetical protein
MDDMLYKYIHDKIIERMAYVIDKKLGLYLKNIALDKKSNFDNKKKASIVAFIKDTKVNICIPDDVISQIRLMIQGAYIEKSICSLTSEDLDNYIQTMQVVINGKKMLQDASGILYDNTPENNIIGFLNKNNKIEWYEGS